MDTITPLEFEYNNTRYTITNPVTIQGILSLAALQRSTAAIISDPCATLLTADSQLWGRLLLRASQVDPDLCLALRVLRAAGVVLEQNAGGTYRIRPVIADSWYESEAAYMQDPTRLSLSRWRQELQDLLRGLGYNEEVQAG